MVYPNENYFERKLQIKSIEYLSTKMILKWKLEKSSSTFENIIFLLFRMFFKYYQLPQVYLTLLYVYNVNDESATPTRNLT